MSACTRQVGESVGDGAREPGYADTGTTAGPLKGERRGEVEQFDE